MVNHRSLVSLTGLGVHVSMILCEFLNHRHRFTFLIITKEAYA